MAEPSSRASDQPQSAPDDAHVIEGLREGAVPSWLRTSASVAWRAIVVAGAIVIIGILVSRFQVIAVPLIVAALIAAVFSSPVRWLSSHGFPPLLATWIVLLAGAVAVAAAAWFLAPRLADGFADLGGAVEESYEDVKDWLVTGPFGLDREDITETETQVLDRIRSVAETELPSRAGFVVELVTGFFLTLVIAFFYIKDGPQFRNGIVRLLPKQDRHRALASFQQGWWVVQRYLLGVVVVGAVDAAIIGIGLALIGVPHVVPMMALTFLAAFFPLVGAILAGAVATLLALASGGVGDALLVIALTVVVQQVDGDVVAPLVFSRAVNLHPLAVLIALTGGAVIAGIVGAFLAVPILAVVMAVARTWREAGDSPVTREPARLSAD